MPTPENSEALCPFWEKSWEQNIRCETCVTHARLLLRFSSKEARQQHEGAYCNRHEWRQCGYARMLLREYDEEDKK